MHIVHVLSSLNIGGAERFVLDLAKIQVEQGHKVCVFSCSPAEEALFPEASNQGFACQLSMANLKQDKRFILDFLKGGEGRVLQIHSPWALRYFLLFLPILFFKGVKIIYTRHGMAALTNKRWALPHFFARIWVHWVTFVSQAGLDVFHETFGWRQSRLVKISNGVYVPSHFKGIESDKIRLGSVGRMVALKGQKDLITAVAKLDRRVAESIEIHFFGDGSERGQLEAMCQSMLTPKQACFHGMVLDRDQVYSHIDILVVSSEQEGLSLAIMEAMARNIPVIATRVGDSPKLVLDAQTGFLYEYQDVPKLSNLIQQLATDGDLVAELGLNAKKHMQANFSLEFANASYEKLYKS